MKLSMKRVQLHYNNFYTESGMLFNACASRIVHKLKTFQTANLNTNPIVCAIRILNFRPENLQFDDWITLYRNHANDDRPCLIKSLTQSLIHVHT